MLIGRARIDWSGPDDHAPDVAADPEIHGGVPSPLPGLITSRMHLCDGGGGDFPAQIVSDTVSPADLRGARKAQTR